MTTLTFDRRGRICADLPNIIDQLAKWYRFGCGSYAPIGSNEWRPIEPADLIQFRLALETSGFASISRRRMRDAVRAIEARL